MHTPAGIEASVSESIVQERYWKIYRSYNRIRRVLASDCNEYLPIYLLHDHLLVEIWHYLSVLDRHYTAQVSRRFRSVALNTAYLWTFIDFGDSRSVPPIDTLLKRAGVAPLHIRVNDHLRAIPYPPSPPLLPVPPKPLLPSCGVIASIPQAAVLDATFWMGPAGTSFQYQVEPILRLEDLTMAMPLLRSLRLSIPPPAGFPYHIQRPPTEPLFGGDTPLLRHVALIQCNLNWSDPVFRGLIYLLIRGPGTPLCISDLIQILLASPYLTYLSLEAVIAPGDPDKMHLSVELPALQRLYIKERDTKRIITTLKCISAPNVLECDFTSSDSAWFDTTMGFSPFTHLQATQDMTITVNEYRWIIECRWDAKIAVRFHSDLDMNYFLNPTPNYEIETVKLIDMLRGSPILFDRVQSLTVRGDLSVKSLKQAFALFPTIKRLSTRHLCPPHNDGVRNGSTILDILSIEHCPQLREIDIGAWPEIPSSSLITWLSARSEPESSCVKLSNVIVTSEKPLPSEARSRIVAMLDKFLWRKSTAPKPPCDGQYLFYPYSSMHLPIVPDDVPSPITEVTTQLIEGGSWDEDDEEWARARPLLDPIHPFSQNTNLSALDDPTLVYCDQALQGRWDYFTIPGA